MTKNEIVADLARERKAEKIIRNLRTPCRMDRDAVQDLAQMAYLALLETDEEKVQRAYERGEIRFLLTAILKNNLTPTGRYYQQFAKHDIRKTNLEDAKEIADEQDG